MRNRLAILLLLFLLLLFPFLPSWRINGYRSRDRAERGRENYYSAALKFAILLLFLLLFPFLPSWRINGSVIDREITQKEGERIIIRVKIIRQ